MTLNYLCQLMQVYKAIKIEVLSQDKIIANGMNINLINKASPATFGTTAKKLVIDVGAPS